MAPVTLLVEKLVVTNTSSAHTFFEERIYTPRRTEASIPTISESWNNNQSNELTNKFLHRVKRSGDYTEEQIREFCAAEIKDDPELTLNLCRRQVQRGRLKLPTEDPFRNCQRLPPKPMKPKLRDVEKTLEAVIQQGMDQLILNEQKDVVLVLGNTGAGKSTLTQIIAGDLNRLHSVLTTSNKTIIIDDDDRIGLPTIKSKTLVPELVIDIDKTFNSVFYDCPGFSDNRGAIQDIAANYFVKKVTDHVENVKMLFLAIYSSFKIGNDRLDFDRLVTHAVKFVKNVDKFQNSTGLVVTKVSSYSDHGSYLSDEVILIEIVEFLKSYVVIMNGEVEKNIAPPSEITIMKNKVKFVDGLLLTDANGTYSKIGFSRVPDKCGPFSKIPSVLKTKSDLIKLYQNLDFKPKNDSDFGYTLRAETLVEIYNFKKDINLSIQNYTKAVVSDFEVFNKVKVETENDLLNTVSKLDTDYRALSIVEDKISKSQISLQDFVTILINTFQEIGYKVHPTYSMLMLQKGEILEFFEIVTEKKVDRQILLWSTPIFEIRKNLRNSKDMYNFLKTLQTELSKYSFHKNKTTNFEVNNLLQCFEFINQTVQISLPVDAHVVEIFTNQTGATSLLVDIIKYTLDAPLLVYNENRDEMRVTGRYVKLSDYIVDNLPKNCPECKSIEIYATSTIFIDSDINAVGKQITISIVAPKWEIIGRNTFNLNGKNGGSLTKAPNGIGKGDHGKDGKPGTPGGNSGNFFGMGVNFENSEGLTILANGGIGGNGEEGGNGATGIDGEDMTYEKLPTCPSAEEIKMISPLGKVDTGLFVQGAVHHGEKGRTGGNGGCGGVGGLGGYQGQLQFVSLVNNTRINISAERGKTGEQGVRGKGGLGGKNGNNIRCQNTVTISFLKLCTSFNWVEGCNIINVTDRGKTGHNGYCSGSTTGRQIVRPKVPTFNLIHWKFINRYKELVLNKHQPLASVQFMNELEKNPAISNSMYSTVGYSEELSTLIKYFYTEKTKIDFQPLFKSLLNRVEFYSNHPQSNETDIQYKVVLNYIYLTALGKIYSLSQDTGSRVVVNTVGYFDIVSNNIEKGLRNAQIVVVIQERKKMYESELNKKIEEALKFISEAILPSIDNIEEELDTEIAELLEETTKLRALGRAKLKELEITKRKFERTMILRGVFSGLKLMGQAASFLGPKGAAVGGAINAAVSITESLVLDDSIKVGSQIQFPVSIKNHAANIDSNLKSHKESQIKIFTSQITEVKKTFAENTEKLGSLSAAIKRAEDSVEGFKQVEINSMHSDDYLVALNKLENEKEMLKVKFYEKEAALKTEQELNDKLMDDKTKSERNNEKAVKALLHTQNVIRTAEVSYEIYNKHKNDAAKLDQFGQAIKEAEQNIRNTELYKVGIYEILIPLANQMKSTTTNTINNLDGKSNVALDVTKWEVKSKLKDMKIKMKQFTEGQKLQENFIHCIENLEEAMTILIDLYDSIEKFEGNKRLADLIANVNSASARQIQVTNPELMSAVSELELTIQSDLFFSLYKTAIHTFKQWVFPFSKYYLQEYKAVIGSNMSYLTNGSANEREVVTNFYKDKIQNLKQKLELYNKTTFGNHDNDLIQTNFTSALRSSQPFFVWSNGNWQNSIRDILSGKSVQMKADIVHSPQSKGAIKFKLIEINFKSSDISAQQQIDEKLKDFTVTMTHSGISYYRFKDEYFTMHGDYQTIRYNFERNGNDRTGTNNIYEKFKNGDYLLSPYALWTIQLTKAKPNNVDINFDELIKFSRSVDLELVGSGTYVDESTHSNDNLNLRDYYEVDESIRSEFKMGKS